MDVIERSILFNGRAIVTCMDTTDLVNEAISIHNLSDHAAQAMGRTLTMAAFMSGMFKGAKNTITIIVDGGGPLGKIVVCGDYGAKVRGYVEHPDYQPNKLKKENNFSESVGSDGTLVIRKDLGLKEPYVGQSHLVSGNISDDFMYYYKDSEQLPTVISCNVLMKDGKCEKAGAIIVQTMPNCSEEQIAMLEDSMANFNDIAGMLKEKTPKEIIAFYYEFFQPSVLEAIYPTYTCTCNRERVVAVVKMLGKKEAYAIADEIGYIESRCHFCPKVYRITKEELKQIF